MFRIYYSDFSTYSGPPAEAPGLGVVVVVQDDPDVGRMVMARWDYYCWHGEQWWGHDLIGLMDCLAQPGWNNVIIGRTVSQDAWREINRLALEDPDFAPKSASQFLEQPRGIS